ncbi:hypothetical protein HXX76_012358 [Chlamydomonas incerta]|uniref:FAD-binding FR-type domain-containing protein n=1 Tax=Chlamydomonas incerta TaxID=51695 RepID=A0A835VSC1_CHLIN|nr:hypothetical protein HXX76_012358 [Chlamydomonas incerta]|eukprot:KAG2427422.1 hypothetical protein HXX76_012358 [Chlamydomonas incerta]
MGAAPGWAARANAAQALSASLFFRLLILAGCGTFAFFWCVTPTRWYLVREAEFLAWRNSLILPYTFINGTTGRTTPLLSGTISWLVIWQWTTTLAVALGAAGLLWVASLNALSSNACAPKAASKRPHACWSLGRAIRKALTRARRVLSQPLPPGGMWRALLGPGGLSLLDLLLILFWFAIHAMWMYEMTMRILDNRRANPPPPKPRSPPPAVAARPPPAVSAASSASSTSSPTFKPATRHLLGAAHSRLLLQAQSQAPPPSASAAAPPKSANSTAKAAPPPPPVRRLKPLPEVVQDSVAKYSGWVGRLDLLLLFFPLPRCNFLHWALGSDFPTLVRYHRWLGHGTLLVYSIHGITYMGMWASAGTLTTMLDWGMGAGVNRLAGLIALCGGWLLWITSIPIIRRRFFNVFYINHVLGALIFLLFGFMHRKDVATWIMPGIFLYLLDVVLRTIQQCFNATRVSLVAPAAAAAQPAAAVAATGAKRSAGSLLPHGGGGVAASLSRDGGVLTLTIPCDQSMTWCGGDILFLNLPCVSWWQWHPFTLANASATFDLPAAAAAPTPVTAASAKTSAGLPTFTKDSSWSDASSTATGAGAAEDAAGGAPRDRYMQVHIKKYNAWTRGLMKQLEAAGGGSSLALYVSGPYHPPTLTGSNSYSRRLVQRFRRHVFVAGGIGVTPALGMLQELIAARRSSDSNSGSGTAHGRVTFVWVSRSADELEAVLPAEVLEEANRGKDGWLDMQLYITGSSSRGGSSGKAAAAAASQLLPPSAAAADDHLQPAAPAASAVFTVNVVADATTADTSAAAATATAAATAAAAAPNKLANLAPAFSRSFATFSRALSGISSLHRSGSGSTSDSDSGVGSAMPFRRLTGGGGGCYGLRSAWDVVAAVVFLPGYLLVMAAGGVRWAAFGAVKARPLAHPYIAGGPLVWAAAVVLCFAGGFGGLITSQAYDGYISRTVAVRSDFSYVGMLQFAALGVGAALGPALLALVMHAVCSLRSLKRRPAANPAPSAATEKEAAPRQSVSGYDCSPADSLLGVAAAVTAPAAATTAAGTAFKPQQQTTAAAAAPPAPTTAAYISAGRPDLKTILTHAAAPYALNEAEAEATADGGGDDAAAVGVFVAGPARLVAAAADTCAAVNGLWTVVCGGGGGGGARGRAYLELHALTHEL